MDAIKEAKILELLDHPNITRFHEVYRTRKGFLCIVMDYCDGGDLQGAIRKQAKQRTADSKPVFFGTEHILDWFTQVALALKHCHDKKILHRDLKAQNIFLTERGIIKLGDFGIARVLSNTLSKPLTTVGTPYYLSPEIIKSEPYDAKSDIWSLGVLLYEMTALRLPFSGSSLPKLARRITAGARPPLPDCFQDSPLKPLIDACL